MKSMTDSFHRNCLEKIDGLTPLNTPSRQDSWKAVRNLAHQYLNDTPEQFSVWNIELDLARIKQIRDEGTRNIREALNELSTIRHTGSENGGRLEEAFPTANEHNSEAEDFPGNAAGQTDSDDRY